MKRLDGGEEFLDGPRLDGAVLRGNLRDLSRVNRLMGGVALSRRAVDALVPPSEPLRVLDVGTGAADIPAAFLQAARMSGRRLTVIAVDNRPEVLAAAIAIRPELATMDGLELTVADGRHLPFADGSFDVVHASLVLHHLEPDDAYIVLREMARVAGRGVVVNDLARGRLALSGARILVRLFTANPYTRHDAPMSVRRAYTRDEAIPLLIRAGLRPVYSATGLAGHRWVIAAVRA